MALGGASRSVGVVIDDGLQNGAMVFERLRRTCGRYTNEHRGADARVDMCQHVGQRRVSRRGQHCRVKTDVGGHMAFDIVRPQRAFLRLEDFLQPRDIFTLSTLGRQTRSENFESLTHFVKGL